jgi:signal transduction histidine kinase
MAAVAVTAVALAGTALVLLAALQSSATDTAMAEAQQRAAEIAAQLRAEGSVRMTAQMVGDPDRLVRAQVVGPTGAVLADTARIGAPPLSPMRPVPGEQMQSRDVLQAGDDDPAVVAAAGVAVGGQNHVVLVAVGLGAVRDTVEAATTVLVVGLPLLLVVVAGTVYALVGRALHPVEAIRAQVAEIEQSDLARRVPEPGGSDEIASLARTMNAMLTRLDMSQRAQRRFVADASHELRSPLATLGAHLDVAGSRGGQLDDVARAAMQTELRRLARLVEDLLLLARADERGLRRAPQELDLDDVLDEERARLRRTTALNVTAVLAPVKIVGERSELVRMVRNLVDNAARFARTSIHLGLRIAAGRAVIDVADDGPGIPPADRERVLQRFVRLDDARSAEGSGLGLAIVAEIASSHGGTVRVGERAGGGALVQVELPGAVGADDWAASDDQRPSPTMR